MAKETNNNEAKDWLLAGVFTVMLGAVLAALFYYLDDLMAGLFIITVLLIMMTGTYFIQKNNQESHSGKAEDIQQ